MTDLIEIRSLGDAVRRGWRGGLPPDVFGHLRLSHAAPGLVHLLSITLDNAGSSGWIPVSSGWLRNVQANEKGKRERDIVSSSFTPPRPSHLPHFHPKKR